MDCRGFVAGFVPIDGGRGMAVDWTKPLRTKDGRKARFLGMRKTLGKFTHIVAVEGTLGQEEEFVHYYRPDGTYPYGASHYNLDLVNEPERVSRYTMMNKNPHMWGYSDRDQAVQYSSLRAGYRVVRVDFEDGKPVAIEAVD